MGTGSDDLYALSVEYLTACLTALADTPAGPPSRYYISPGPPAWDCCDQLTVHTTGPATADTFPLQPMLAPGHRAQNQGKVNLIGVVATILRCAPMLGEDGTLPDPIAFNTCSRQTCADMWAIWNHVSRAVRAKTLFTSTSDQREVFFDPAVAQIQQGGCAGWGIGIRVALDGYVPVP